MFCLMNVKKMLNYIYNIRFVGPPDLRNYVERLKGLT